MKNALFIAFVVTALASACDEERPRGPGLDASVGGDAGDAALDADPPSDAGTDTIEPVDSGTDAADTATPMSLCPPAPPYGVSPGDTAADVVLTDCDGVEYRLHDMCDAPVSWVFEYADWCPICRDFAPIAESLYQRFSPMGLQAWFVIVADGSFDRPDAALCATIRERYGLTMPVLFDATGELERNLSTPGNDYNLVMTRGMHIEWEGHYRDGDVEGQLERLFAAP